METLTNKKQPLQKKKTQSLRKGSKRNLDKESLRPSAPEQDQPPGGEGLYELVRQDVQLRQYHAAKLRSTAGYGHLSEEEAGDMAEQMLRLVTLTYEMLKDGQDRPCQDNYYTGMAA